MYKKKKHIIVALCVVSLTFSLVAMEEYPPFKPSFFQQGKSKVMGIINAFGKVTKIGSNIEKRKGFFVDRLRFEFFHQYKGDPFERFDKSLMIEDSPASELALEYAKTLRGPGLIPVPVKEKILVPLKQKITLIKKNIMISVKKLKESAAMRELRQGIIPFILGRPTGPDFYGPDFYSPAPAFRPKFLGSQYLGDVLLVLKESRDLPYIYRKKEAEKAVSKIEDVVSLSVERGIFLPSKFSIKDAKNRGLLAETVVLDYLHNSVLYRVPEYKGVSWHEDQQADVEKADVEIMSHAQKVKKMTENLLFKKRDIEGLKEYRELRKPVLRRLRIRTPRRAVRTRIVKSAWPALFLLVISLYQVS